MGSKLRNRHRCNVEICASILSIFGESPLRKTWIMNGANLNHALATRHLGKLVDCGFLECNEEESLYELTKDGRAFLDEFSRFKRIETKLLGLTE